MTHQIPNFYVETLPAGAGAPTAEWACLGPQSISMHADRIHPDSLTRHDSPNGSRTIVVGHVILGDRIANVDVAQQAAYQIHDDAWLASLNGEFLLLHAQGPSLQIISSRFGYPPFWYAFVDGKLLGGTLFAAVWDRMQDLGRTGVNTQSLFETLVYKRVFGTKSPHPDIFALPPAHRLTLDPSGLRTSPYWAPDFSRKLSLSPQEAAEELSGRLKKSLQRKTSDGRRYALFLSGGMDTRLVLAHAAELGLELPCITINAFENREVLVARRAAELTGQKHIFMETPQGHYRSTLDEAVRLTGAMTMPMCMFHGHQEAVAPIADVGLHGHGFDYFFQGMYIPSRRYTILGRTIPYRTRRAISGDIVTDFLDTISYKLRGNRLSDVARPPAFAHRMEILRAELSDIASAFAGRAAEPGDTYEWLAFHNLARHYSIGDHWGMNTVVEQRTISFDNDLYDFYARLPSALRFDARVMRLCLERRNPALAQLISANHGYPIGLSSAERTLRAAARFLRRRLRPMQQSEATEFDRMGLPQQHLITGEWREAMYELANSPRLAALDFLDEKAAKRLAHEAADGKKLRDPQFLSLLMTVDRFLMNHTRNG
ncbi:MAG: asparagine synthase-related protein [Ferrovibrio sp.]|uniref:asparagine synthase-related protein n=1 Tax=Ferrovibrio sp. TaxID=1917215 RepID=UPI002635E6E1|nr:asparagine synthase-related protein [Ferrovibrio sp.]MCW0234951.1 asparagine synthase-related protein [Ferrovibrio sp.]